MMMLEMTAEIYFLSSSAMALPGYLHYCNEVVNCLDIFIVKMRY